MAPKLKEQPTSTRPESAQASTGGNLIGGAWQTGNGPQTRRIANPADTKETIAEVREASTAQVDEACAAAAKAFPAWRAVPPPDRARYL
ncbi:MAG: aldehyde dehydrogenase family protein, partial [Gemmataceae bacterium]